MQLDESKHRILVIGCGALLVVVTMWIRFGYGFELPPKPPRPEVIIENAAEYSRNIARSEGSYDSYIARDSKSLGLRNTPTRETMSGVFEYYEDTDPKEIGIGESLRAGDIEIKALRVNVSGSRKKHLALEISNKTGKFLAYRIKTSLPINHQICKKKRTISHNAIALGPRQTQRRSECIYRENVNLTVESIETMVLPELAYLYLSAVQPDKIGLERRTTAGHKAPVRSFNCQLIPSVVIERGLKRGTITWRDMADFYARHRCSTYSFPPGYKAFTKNNEQRLPAVESNKSK